MPAPTLVLPTGAPRAEWLEARRSGIGGSDVAALVGVHPNKTALHVYLDKVDDDRQDEAGEAAYWGSLLEPVVADHWARIHGKHLAEAGTYAHHDRPWMLANVDRLIFNAAGDPLPEEIYEGKTANQHKTAEWEQGERIPDHYQAQCQWYLGVWGLPRARIACLIGGQRFVEATIERDEEIIDGLITVAAEFWQRVINRDPPSLDGEPVGPALDMLRLIHGTSNGKTVDIGDRGLALLGDYQQAKAEESAAKTRADEARRDLWAILGDAEVGTVDGQEVVKLANEPKAEHVRKASNPRVLRPKKKALESVRAGRAREEGAAA